MEYKIEALVKPLEQIIKYELPENGYLTKNQIEFLLEYGNRTIQLDSHPFYEDMKRFEGLDIPETWLTCIKPIPAISQNDYLKDKRESFFSHNKNKDIKELIDILIEEDKKREYINWNAAETMELFDKENKTPFFGGMFVRPKRRTLRINDKKVIGFIVEDK